MKRAKPHHSPLPTLLTVALLVVLTALPTVWFAVYDRTLLPRETAAEDPYQNRTLTGDDFYLLHQLRERESRMLTSRTLSGEPVLYRNNALLDYDPSLDSETVSRFDALYAAGVLPQDWYALLLFTTADDSQSMYGTSDTMGFLDIFCSTETSGYEMTLHAETGAMTHLFVYTTASDTSEPLPPLDTDTILHAWIEQAGLQELGNWTSAPDTILNGQNMLYSETGNAAVSAVCDKLVDANGELIYFFELQLYGDAASAMQTAYPARETAPGDSTSDLHLVTHNSMLNTGRELYRFSFGETGGSEQPLEYLYRFDYSDGTQTLFCNRPNCAHLPKECPATWDYEHQIVPYIFEDNGVLYLMSLSTDPSNERLTFLSSLGDTEPLRQLRNEVLWNPSSFKTTLLRFDGQTFRPIELQESIEFSIPVAVGNGWLYLCSDQTLGPAIRNYRLELSTGRVEPLPRLNGMTMVSAADGWLILGRLIPPGVLPTRIASNASFANTLADNAFELLCWNPDTDEIYTLYRESIAEYGETEIDAHSLAVVPINHTTLLLDLQKVRQRRYIQSTKLLLDVRTGQVTPLYFEDTDDPYSYLQEYDSYQLMRGFELNGIYDNAMLLPSTSRADDAWFSTTNFSQTGTYEILLHHLTPSQPKELTSETLTHSPPVAITDDGRVVLQKSDGSLMLYEPAA